MKDKTKHEEIHKAALALLRDAAFLSRVFRKLRETGLVGEQLNALVVFLACVTKVFKKPVSVIVKGNSSSGKSNLLKAVCALFPSDCVMKRSSLTEKAPVYGEDSLAGRILFLAEYRGGRESMYLTRLQQSEGEVSHEFTTGSGKGRGTTVALRKGSPVVLTSTTEKKVFVDDETRFLSIRADDSPELTRQIVIQQFAPTETASAEGPAAVWREATRILTEKSPIFVHPKWLTAVASRIPADDTRARRDAGRFRSLLDAVALVLSFSDGRREEDSENIEVQFTDYCIAYQILNEAFSSTYRGVQPQALRIFEAVTALHKARKGFVTVQEIAEHLGWENQVTYKWTKAALKQNLILLEPGTREKNVKRYAPRSTKSTLFLPDPQSVLNDCTDLPESVKYLDPLSGAQKKLRKVSAAGAAKSAAAAD